MCLTLSSGHFDAVCVICKNNKQIPDTLQPRKNIQNTFVQILNHTFILLYVLIKAVVKYSLDRSAEGIHGIIVTVGSEQLVPY